MICRSLYISTRHEPSETPLNRGANQMMRCHLEKSRGERHAPPPPTASEQCNGMERRERGGGRGPGQTTIRCHQGMNAKTLPLCSCSNIAATEKGGESHVLCAANPAATAAAAATYIRLWLANELAPRGFKIAHCISNRVPPACISRRLRRGRINADHTRTSLALQLT